MLLRVTLTCCVLATMKCTKKIHVYKKRVGMELYMEHVRPVTGN